MGRKGEKKKRCEERGKEGSGWQGGRRRKVRLEKRRKVNEPGSWDGTKKVRRSGEKRRARKKDSFLDPI